jgi:hypothetical protein
MAAESPGVFCGNCGRELDFGSQSADAERKPCPVCGSTERDFRKSGGATVGRRLVTASVAIPIESLRGVKTTRSTTERAAAIRGRYRATLQWHRLEDGLWLLQVLNEDGDVVEGGIGDDPDEALLEVYERLVPPR